MNAADTLQIPGLESTLPGNERSAPAKPVIGLSIANPTHRRLIESASVQLELITQDLALQNIALQHVPPQNPAALNTSAGTLDIASLGSFELIVADEPTARRMANAFAAFQDPNDRIAPAIIAVRSREELRQEPREEPREELREVSTEAGVTVSRISTPVSGSAEALADQKSSRTNQEFDAILALPMELAPIVAQLSVIFYAHRAFARRYHSALEELNLNRRIFRSVTSGISVADATLPDMPLTYVNPAFEVMTGYALEDVMGKNCRFLQGDEHEQPGLTMIREAIAAKREVVAIIRNFHKNGTFFWNELSLSPIFNRDRELTHFVGIQTDITARVEFESALRESEKLAAVGRLASSIAHEINNPLESVTNLIYLAQHCDSLAEAKQFLATAEKELRRVSLITAQSLRFYKQSTRPQAVTSHALLESVLDLYQGKLENARIRVERRERLTQSFSCMESEIRQVLNNLIRNALDAMATGGRLQIRSREATDWRTLAKGVLITIADTGSGISPDTMKQIYKAFFTTKGIGGTGLGLWICSEIVARHHGRLRVRSRQRIPTSDRPSGTIFELFLPFQGIAS